MMISSRGNYGAIFHSITRLANFYRLSSSTIPSSIISPLTVDDISMALVGSDHCLLQAIISVFSSQSQLQLVIPQQQHYDSISFGMMGMDWMLQLDLWELLISSNQEEIEGLMIPSIPLSYQLAIRLLSLRDPIDILSIMNAPFLLDSRSPHLLLNQLPFARIIWFVIETLLKIPQYLYSGSAHSLVKIASASLLTRELYESLESYCTAGKRITLAGYTMLKKGDAHEIITDTMIGEDDILIYEFLNVDGVDITTFSQVPQEDQILLQAPATFRVVNCIVSGRCKRLILEQLTTSMTYLVPTKEESQLISNVAMQILSPQRFAIEEQNDGKDEDVGDRTSHEPINIESDTLVPVSSDILEPGNIEAGDSCVTNLNEMLVVEHRGLLAPEFDNSHVTRYLSDKAPAALPSAPSEPNFTVQTSNTTVRNSAKALRTLSTTLKSSSRATPPSAGAPSRTTMHNLNRRQNPTTSALRSPQAAGVSSATSPKYFCGTKIPYKVHVSSLTSRSLDGKGSERSGISKPIQPTKPKISDTAVESKQIVQSSSIGHSHCNSSLKSAPSLVENFTKDCEVLTNITPIAKLIEPLPSASPTITDAGLKPLHTESKIVDASYQFSVESAAVVVATVNTVNERDVVGLRNSSSEVMEAVAVVKDSGEVEIFESVNQSSTTASSTLSTVVVAEPINLTLDCEDGVPQSDRSLKTTQDKFLGTCGRNLTGHSKCVFCILSLRNGIVVTGSGDRTLKLWNFGEDIITNDIGSESHDMCIMTLTGHTGDVYCLAETEDQLILSGSRDGTIRAWNRHERSCEVVFRGHRNAILCVQELNDGTILSGSLDCTMKIWDCTGGCIRTLTGHSGPVNYIVTVTAADIFMQSGSLSRSIEIPVATSFQYSGELILSAGGDGLLKLWNPRHGQCLRTFVDKCEQSDIGIDCLHRISPGRIVAGSQDGYIREWDLQSGEGGILRSWKGHTGAVLGLNSFIYPQKAPPRMLSSSMDKTIRVWNLESLAEPSCEICMEDDDAKAVTSMTLHYVNKAQTSEVKCMLIVSGHADGRIRIWS